MEDTVKQCHHVTYCTILYYINHLCFFSAILETKPKYETLINVIWKTIKNIREEICLIFWDKGSTTALC